MVSGFCWKTTEVAARQPSSKCLQTPAERVRERKNERERGEDERERGARHITRGASVHAQISRTCSPPICRVYSPVLRLYSSIFQNEEYSQINYSLVIKSPP